VLLFSGAVTEKPVLERMDQWRNGGTLALQPAWQSSTVEGDTPSRRNGWLATLARPRRALARRFDSLQSYEFVRDLLLKTPSIRPETRAAMQWKSHRPSLERPKWQTALLNFSGRPATARLVSGIPIIARTTRRIDPRERTAEPSDNESSKRFRRSWQAAGRGGCLPDASDSLPGYSHRARPAPHIAGEQTRTRPCRAASCSASSRWGWRYRRGAAIAEHGEFLAVVCWFYRAGFIGKSSNTASTKTFSAFQAWADANELGVSSL
jgi:hypothetical protein